MNNKKRILIIVCLFVAISSIFVGSVAYYRMTFSGSISANTGNAVFVLKDENSNVWDNKVISLNNGNKIKPGDSGSFTVTLDASSSAVDMYATLEIDKGTLPTNLKFYSTSDKKSEIHKYYSFLEKNGTNSETLTIYWYWNPFISNEEDNKFINKSNLEATIKVNAVQISEYATMKNGYSGKTEFWSDTYKPYIRMITFGNDLSNLPSECTEENLCWDISVSSYQNKKVYGYLVDSGLTDDSSKTLYNLYIVSDAPIFAPGNCSYIFIKFASLIKINFNNNFNTSNVENMRAMFDECSSLTELDLSSFNTKNVTNMNGMFYECSSLTNLDLNGFNTKKVEYMDFMFAYCSSLTNLDLSNFNTSNVWNMRAMFHYCSSLTNLDLSSFNTTNVEDMGFMFAICSSLINLDLSNFNTSNVWRMDTMFHACSSLTNLDLSSFNTTNVEDMSFMFYGCTSLTNLDLSSFNTTNVEIMNYMFSSCSSLTTTINIMSSGVTDYMPMFDNAATESGAKITVNYIADASTLVDSMIATKSSNSNVVKGNQL